MTTTNEDIMRAIGQLEAKVEAIQADVRDVKTYGQTNSARISSLERSRAALWAAVATAKVMIVAGFTYFTQRGA